MKKLALFLVTMLVAAATFGQVLNGFRPVYIVPDTATYFKSRIEKGDLVYVTAFHRYYELTVATGRGAKMADVIAAGEYVYPTWDNVGNTSIVGTLGVSGATTVGGTLGVTGATTLSSTLGVTGASTMRGNVGIGTTGGNLFQVTASNGNVGIGTTDLNKFTVAGATGNTAIAGTLGVTGVTTMTGNVGIGTTGGNLFQVTASNGNVGIGTTDLNKFTIAGATGNTVIAGTLSAKSATVGSASDTIPFYVWDRAGKKWKISVAVNGVLYMVTVTP